MKITLLIAMLAATALAQQKDVRIVNGVAVDLGPLHQWLAKPQGDRPLKHWKILNIQTALPSVGGLDTYHVRSDAGEFNIAIKNISADTREFMAGLASTATAISNLTTQVKALDWQIQHADSANSDYNTANMYNPYAPHVYVKATARQELADMRDRLRELQDQYSAALAASPEKATALAMFTGQVYSGTPIWDCGRHQ